MNESHDALCNSILNPHTNIRLRSEQPRAAPGSDRSRPTHPDAAPGKQKKGREPPASGEHTLGANAHIDFQAVEQRQGSTAATHTPAAHSFPSRKTGRPADALEGTKAHPVRTGQPPITGQEHIGAILQ